MKKMLKSALLIALGVVIGSSASSFASSCQVSVLVDNVHRIFFSGREVKVSDDMEILNYKGRVYVPLRFVTDNMYRYELIYDSANKKIHINNRNEIVQKPEEKKVISTIDVRKLDEKATKEQEEAKKIAEGKTEKTDSEKFAQLDFKTLPITYRHPEKKATIELFYINKHFSLDGTSVINLKVKNDDQTPFNIDPYSAKFSYETGGDNLITLESPYGMRVEQISLELFSSIPQKFEKELHFPLEQIPDDVSRGVLSFEVKWIGSQKPERVYFPVKFN